MIKYVTIFGVALVAQAAWANVRFPTDGQLETDLQKEEVAAQIQLPLVVTLKAMAQVASSRIYMQDVAVCAGPGFGCDELLSIDLEDSALPGRTKVIAIERIRHLLEQELVQYSVKIEGPNAVRVTSKYLEIAPKEVEDALQAVVKSKINSNDLLRLRSLNIQMPRSIKAWPGDYRLVFPLVQDAQVQHLDWIVEHFLGDKSWTMIYEPLGIGANRGEVHRITVHLELEMQLPVARTHIARGTVLKHEHLEYKWMRVGRNSMGMVHEVKNVVGLLTKQAVRSGSPLSYRMLEVPEVVTRGEKVKMLIKRNGLNVSAEGKALKSGGVGQAIAVFYPATKKTVQGIVLPSGAVEVQL